MKILQINNHHYNLGGTEAVYLNTIRLLNNKNHTVISLSKENPNNIYTPAIEYFVSYKESLINKFYSFDVGEIIDRIVKSDKPEIAHVHNLIGGITFSALSKLKKHNIPIVATIHDFRLLCPSYVFMNGKKEICEKCKHGGYYNCVKYKCVPGGYPKALLVSIESYLRDYLFPFQKLIDKFIFVSNFSKNKFIETYPEISLKAVQLYNFSEKEKNNLIKKGEYFLFIGRLSYEKGIKTLLDAFEDVKEIKLIIAGDGPLKKIVEHNKNPNISYVGYKSGDELNNLIKNSSFVIIPSECYENNPLSIVEAYANSKPVIGSRLGGIKEIVLEGNNGFTFEHGNSKDLRDVLNKAAIIDEENYASLSMNACKFYETNFTSSIHYEKLFAIYKKTLEEQKIFIEEETKE